jgi:hypothetical protein
VLGLGGCSENSVLDRLAPDKVKEARTDFDYLRHGQYDQIEPLMDASIDRSTLRDKLQQMANLIPAGDPTSVKTVGVHTQWDSQKGTETQVDLEYQFPAKYIALEMIFHTQDDKTEVTSFYVYQESQSLEEANRFTFTGKEPVQYVILGAAIGSLALMIYAFVLCIRTPMEKRKWLWIILVFVGVAKVGVDWTTGETYYRILYIFIPAATAGKDLYGPWSISVSIPLGALLFLIYRERLRRHLAPASETVNLTDGGDSGLHSTASEGGTPPAP